MYCLSTVYVLLFSFIFVTSQRVPNTLRKYKICNRQSCKSVRSLSEDLFDTETFGFSRWTNWSPCTRRCSTTRYRSCRFPLICGHTVVHEEAFCYHRGTLCEQIYSDSQTNFLSDYSSDSDYENEEFDEYGPHFPADIRRRDYDLPDRNNRMSRNHNVKRYPDPLPLRFSNMTSIRPNSDRTSRLAQKSHFGTHDDSSNNGPFQIDNSGDQNRFQTCGVARTYDQGSRMSLRILGGQESMKGRWPWQVAIVNSQQETFCGGTLIAPRWILTAAHCVRRRIEIIIGEHHLNRIDGTEKHYHIDAAFIHPDFDIDTVDNDIALLLLPEAVPLHAEKACLPSPNDFLPSPNTLCTILGWGKERYNHVFGTTVLHEGKVPIVSNAECRFTYNRYEITSNMFCAGYQGGTVDSCAGDSGGPLLCSVNQRWTIFGVTSFGDGCGRRGKFGIYAKVPNYVNWIRRVMDANAHL